MHDKRLRILNYAIAAVMLIAVAMIYPGLPDRIPTNWGFNGDISYGNKNQIWLFTGMLLLFAFMYDFLPHIDPKKKNYQKFSKIYDFFCVGIQIFLSVTIGIIVSESYAPGRIQAVKVIFIMMALLFVLIGNYLPKIQSNFYWGIKTPWTLTNDKVWRKTHRFAGKMYVGCGVLGLLSMFVLPVNIAGKIFVALIIISSLVITLASYLLWRKVDKED